MIKSLSRFRKVLSLLMLFTFMINYWGNEIYAAPGGPSQPEFSAFKPISSSDMVDKFSGGFSYNVPLFDLGGYPVNMFYDGSVSNDVEASWVGLGWNLNTGSINRNKRGLPDDYKGEEIQKFVKKDNVSRFGVSPGLHVQIANMLGFGVKGGIYYSSLTGFGTEASFGKSLGIPIINKGGMNLGLGLSENTSSSSEGGVTNSFNLGVSVGKSFDMSDKVSGGLTLGASYGETTNSRQGLLQSGFKVSMDAKVTKSNYTAEEKKTIESDFKELKTPEAKAEFVESLKETNPSLGDKSFSTRLGGVGFTKSYIDPTFTPTMEIPYKTVSFSLNLKGGTHGYFVDGGGTLDGYAVIQKIANNNLKSKGFGYMYSEFAKDQADRLMDFNREKDVAFHVKTPHIAIPIQTYDLFSINQHQNGGQFRAFRNDVGLLLDKEVATEKDDYNMNLEGHGGVGFELGGTIELVNAETKTYPVIEDQIKPYDFNRFSSDDYPVREKFFFRKSNELELTDPSFQTKINQLAATNLQLLDNGSRSGILESSIGSYANTLSLQKFFNEDNFKIDGRFFRPNNRNTFISFLDAKSRAKYSMQKQILNFSTDNNSGYLSNTSINSDNNDNLISEFSVVNPDGMKYHYGIPVMNTTQEEYSFSLAPRSALTVGGKYTGLVKLNNGELATGPAEDASYDGYYSKETQPKYAHSWLLSGIYSPDYQDVLNDGITEDDRGNAVKFNYTNRGKFGWRNPVHPTANSTDEVAAHSKGVEFITSDDKAIVNYGEREEWYNHSIESKTMIAYFYTSARLDANSLDRNGKRISGATKQKLDSIKIFSKAEIGSLLKIHQNLTRAQLNALATPSKVIKFSYDYSLCPNTPNNSGTALGTLNVKKGKLTLKQIDFIGGTNSTRYSYKFDYGDINSPIDNPDYNAKNVDRWGNHKPLSNNDIFAPSQNVNNDAFPYVIQDKDLNDPTKRQNNANDKNARAWTLKTIILPSGGTVSVDYESHDYSFVQHKRTARMFKLVGIGATKEDALLKTSLYEEEKSNDYLFFETNLPSGPVYDYNYIKTAFFEDLNDYGSDKYLFYKFRIKLDGGQNKYESLPGYVEIDKENGKTLFGAHKAASNGKLVVWVKVKPVNFTVKTNAPTGVMPGPNALKIIAKFLNKDIQLNPIARNSWQFIMERIPELAWDGYSLGKNPDPFDIITSLAGNISKIFTGERQFEVQAIDRGLAKNVLLDGNSYVRAYIPEKTKFGGNGSRVKKITISDNWDQLVNESNPNLKPERGEYTYEYDYTMLDESSRKISSGVATYEPLIGGEENPWRQPVFYDGQMGPGGPTSVESIEEPFGETLFPSPHVGYSSVKIYSNREKAVALNTGNGYKQYEYFTAKDFPVSSEHTEINDKTLKRDKPSFSFDILGFGSNHDHTSVSQGYSVVLNDMHGKAKSEKYFKHGIDDVPLNSTVYHYKNETKLPMIDDKGQIADKEVGLQTEMYVDNRHQVSKTSSKNISPGGGLEPLIAPPIPVIWATVMGGYTTMETSVKMLSTCKVISKSYPMYKTDVYNEGAKVTTEYLLWDQRTGNVVLSKVNNEYKCESRVKELNEV